MADEDETDTSPEDLFGRTVAALRRAAGYSQAELARNTYGVSGSRLNQIERGTGHPATLANAVALDAKLGAGGVLISLWKAANSKTFPAWSQPFINLEGTALEMRMYGVQVVPGLLQTEPYAREVLSKGRSLRNAAHLEQRVRGRLGRQVRLHEPNAPYLWVVLDEAVIYRQVGGADTMREQLARLLATEDDPHISVQLLPFGAGAHEAMGGSLTVLTTDDRRQVAYTEGADVGRLIEDPDEVAEYAVTYDRQRAVALPVDMSMDIIRDAMERPDRVRARTAHALRLAKVQPQQYRRGSVRRSRHVPRRRPRP